MNTLKIENFSANGLETTQIEFKETGEIGFEISTSELDQIFDNFFENDLSLEKQKMLDEDKVCFKQTINSISHPFQTKQEWDWAIVCVKLPWPLKGEKCVKEKVRPRLYRREVKYVVYAEICYPIDLLVKNVEKCAKQGAIAAAAVALSGELTATQVAFQTAFFACMAVSDFPNADKIGIKIAGDKIHGEWIPV